MKIVIEMPQERYERLDYVDSLALKEIINNGTVLSEPQEGDRAISLNAVLEIVNNPLNIRLEEIIKRLPSVTPKTGHWIDRWWEEGCEGDCVRWRCSECKELSCCNSNFCGDCGAKMD